MICYVFLCASLNEMRFLKFFYINWCILGFVYGAPEGKRLQVFLDDVNLPRCNHYEPPANQVCLKFN